MRRKYRYGWCSWYQEDCILKLFLAGRGHARTARKKNLLPGGNVFSMCCQIRSLTCSFVWTTDFATYISFDALPNQPTLLYISEKLILTILDKKSGLRILPIFIFLNCNLNMRQTIQEPSAPTAPYTMLFKNTHTSSIQFNSIDSHDTLTYLSITRFLMLSLISKKYAFTIQQFSFLTQDVSHNGSQYQPHFISAVSCNRLRRFSVTLVIFIIDRLLAIEIYLSRVFKISPRIGWMGNHSPRLTTFKRVTYLYLFTHNIKLFTGS